jgi:hypothetical protein
LRYRAGGSFAHGTPYTTSQVAWPVLSCGPAPTESDHDGMPDAYETANGLNPSNAADGQTIAANGYTNLENYLNGIASVLLGSKAADAAEKAGLGVYPNPGWEQCTLTHPSAGRPATIDIYTFDGRRVRSATALPGISQTLLPLNGLAHGNYLIRCQGADGPLTVKLLHD